jgi:pyruvate dehydrogenase kinase 2/3/4
MQAVQRCAASPSTLRLAALAVGPMLAPAVAQQLAHAAASRHQQRRALHLRRFTTTDWNEQPMPMEQVRELAMEAPTPLTLQQMRSFADAGNKLRIVSAKFLHKELQSRFARAILELSDLPVGLSQTASVQQAISVYRHELMYINSVKPPSTVEEELRFTENLRNAKNRGSNLVPLICYGLHELQTTDLGKNALKLESVQVDIQERLDKFFLGRIGIRMLIGHHVESLGRMGGRVHMLNVEEIVHTACDRATKLCIQYMGEAPRIEFHAAANMSAPFMYVQSHLHHMVFELVKNAMRATVEHHHHNRRHKRSGKVNRRVRVMDPCSRPLDFVIPSVEDVSGVTIYPDVSKYTVSGEMPPIQIVMCQGNEDLTIKISDEGGGVPRSKWNKLWHYDYTTSPPCPPMSSNSYHSFRQHFCGGGYGLPIARLFARYFGGEVTFTSLEGNGSTAFIQAHRLGTNLEVVPGHASFSLRPLYL